MVEGPGGSRRVPEGLFSSSSSKERCTCGVLSPNFQTQSVQQKRIFKSSFCLAPFHLRRLVDQFAGVAISHPPDELPRRRNIFKRVLRKSQIKLSLSLSFRS